MHLCSVYPCVSCCVCSENFTILRDVKHIDNVIIILPDTACECKTQGDHKKNYSSLRSGRGEECTGPVENKTTGEYEKGKTQIRKIQYKAVLRLRVTRTGRIYASPDGGIKTREWTT